ncbi:uncharacterized protein LOC110819379 [Carica papaya]|uniref:uncharacterized protein LOC110819379 n=1 Tax=Carica papaya TaxID=3649 RepID=UPI000B8CE700|nr:uncharacterized protein LOC110819379 [Carica papaya]
MILSCFIDDPIAKRFIASSQQNLPETSNVGIAVDNVQFKTKESRMEDSAISELQKRLEIVVSGSGPGHLIMDELEDREFMELGLKLIGGHLSNAQGKKATLALRDHWRRSAPRSIPLRELGPLLRDYQRLITQQLLAVGGSGFHSVDSSFLAKDAYKFYHLKNASQLRMDDVPKLLKEYKQLPSD